MYIGSDGIRFDGSSIPRRNLSRHRLREPQNGELADRPDRALSADEIRYTCSVLAPGLHSPLLIGGTVMQEVTTIPPSQWGSFLAQFSAQHCGQEADIEHVDPESVRAVAIRLPLIRVDSAGGSDAVPQFHVCSGDQTGIVEDALTNPIRIKVK